MESHEMSWFFSPEIYVSGLFAFDPVGFVLVNADVDGIYFPNFLRISSAVISPPNGDWRMTTGAFGAV